MLSCAIHKCAGKTTLLKSKAVSLARAGESVTFIFMGGGSGFMGGSRKTEAVMSIANEIDFANYPNVTVLSQQDLEKKYLVSWWYYWSPSPLSLVKTYIEKEKPQHVMVDEASISYSYFRDLDKTNSILTSLPPLFPSSFLWIALHSSDLTDSSIGETPSKTDLEKWKRRLAQTFTIPTLKHNLRNSHEVASARGSFNYNSVQSEALPTAPAPRPLPTLPPSPVCLPILLPLHSSSQLGNAIKHAYTSLESPTTLVVLLDNLNKQDVVKTSLAQLGISVVTYSKPEERTDCKKFLQNPVGALVTTYEIFSGMEAANVIWVRVCLGGDNRSYILHRSCQLRAIHKLCFIEAESTEDGAGRGAHGKFGTGFKVDGTFVKCHKFWKGKLYWCTTKSCNLQPILLCKNCANVCHQSCEREWAVFRSFSHLILQYNPCSCKTSGCCKLERSV